nr:hypothetical protein [Martelella sp. HB161492]
MWTIAAIAERDGVSKMAVSKAVKKLAEAKPDTPIERDGQGRVMRVSLAHYDEFRSRHSNPAKTKAPIRTLAEEPVADSGAAEGGLRVKDSFEEARRQSEWLKVGREKIRHQEAIGQLVRADLMGEAIRQAGSDIQQILRKLQNRADDVAIAVSKEGAHGARIALRKIADEFGNSIADRLGKLAEAAPAEDPMFEEDEG